MNEALYQQKGFLSTLFTAVLIFSIAIATEYFDTLFVHETGNIKIFGGIGIILAIALLLKVRFVRQILVVFTLIALAASLFMVSIANEHYIVPRSILLAALALSTYFLLFSKSLKTYVDRK